MKIIFVNRFFHPDHSATSQLLSDLAFALAAKGREIHVITSRQRYDDPAASLPSAEMVREVRIQRVWTSRFGRVWLPGRAADYLSFYASAVWHLWRLARRGDVIIAKTDPPLISVVAAAVARLRRAHLVNWLQDLFPEVASALGIGFLQGPLPGLLGRLRNASLGSAAMNVVLGERMADCLRAQGITRDRISIIPNWADGEAIQPLAPEENPLRLQWGLKYKFVLGYSGNLGRAHAFETLLKAAEELRGESGIAFLFIGGGYHQSWLEQEAGRRGLDNIFFQPYQPREALRQSLSVADVHLVTLRPALEGYIVPSKLYGILAAGRPVLFIGALEGEIASILSREGCGMAVAEGDVAALVKAVRLLREDPALCRRWGLNARRALLEHFEQSIALQAWTRLLADVAAR